MRSAEGVKIPAGGEGDGKQAQGEPVGPDDEYDLTEDQLAFLHDKIKPVKVMERIFILVIICVGIYIWIGVLKRPVPDMLKRILGMDDTLYPEQYEKYLKAREKAKMN